VKIGGGGVKMFGRRQWLLGGGDGARMYLGGGGGMSNLGAGSGMSTLFWPADARARVRARVGSRANITFPPWRAVLEGLA
jgi:hypothetical protein